MKEVSKVLVYRNSDGFLTEDAKQYKEREKRLKRMQKIRHTSRGHSGMGEYMKLEVELWYWNKSKEERDYQDAREKIILEDNKNRCPECNGKGSLEEHGYFGTANVGCSDCDGTGLTKKYRDKTGRNHIYEDTWYPAR